MQRTYAQKNETAQRAADNTAAAVHDNSPQSECLQRHASLANAAVQRAENPPRPNNTGLPDDLKNGIESLSGYSLDNVRVHYNSPKPATVQALAYTQGTDIHVAAGQEHALPHEAWHVTQQMAGRVTPTTNIGGMPVNDNAALEHEADVMGEKAVTQRMVDGSASSLKSVDLNGGSVQRGGGGTQQGNAPNQGNHLFSSLPAFIEELVGEKSGFKYIQEDFELLKNLRDDGRYNVPVTEGEDTNTQKWTSGMEECRLEAMTLYTVGHGGFYLVDSLKRLARNCVDENVKSVLCRTMGKKNIEEVEKDWVDISDRIAGNILKEMSDGGSKCLVEKKLPGKK